MQAVMGLIIHAGNAKSECMIAIGHAKIGELQEAQDKIDAANEALIEAHHAQTSLLTSEARGENVQPTLMLIHAQDHLMNAITFRDLAKEVIELYSRIDAK
ncbi:PTS lactose/cellobiose transporter subunit IIA [Kurthia sibirica]